MAEQGEPMRLLSLKELTTKTSLSRAGIYRLIRQGLFPPGTCISRRRVWLEEAIDIYIEGLFRPRAEQWAGR